MKRKIKNKMLLTVFTLVMVLSFGIINVNAETIEINSKDDYVNNRTINEETTLRLTENISLEELDLNNSKLEISANLIIDLNGHNLTIPGSSSIYLLYYGNHSVTIKDSSVDKSGMIIKTDTEKGISINENSDTVTDVTLNIDGIRYKNADVDYGIEIYDYIDGEGQSVNVNIKDSTFEIANTLYYGHSAIDTYPSTLNFDIKNSTVKSKRGNTFVYIMPPYNTTLTFDDIMVTGDSEYTYEVYGDGDKLSDTQVVGSIGYKKIEIKKVQRFDIEVPTFANQSEGYASIGAQNIKITAIGTNRRISSVTLNSDAEFELVGVDPEGVWLTENNFDTTATIRPRDNLKYGLHTAIIKVQDTSGNTFTAEVSFNVNAYGEVQVVTGEEDLRKFLEGESRNYPEVTTVRLGDDFVLDNNLIIYVNDGKTLDLNGHALTTSKNITLVYGSNGYDRNIKNADFNVIDSGTTGEIVGNQTDARSLFYISEQYPENEDAFFTFNLNGGTYRSFDDMFDFYFDDRWDDNSNNTFEFNLQNAEFNLREGYYRLINENSAYVTRDNFKIKLEDITVNLKGEGSGLIQDTLDFKVGDIVPNTHRIVYPKIDGDENAKYSTEENVVAERTDLAESVSLALSKPEISNYQIKVERINGFVVDDVTFADAAFGYGEVEPLAISITALGSDRTVGNVTVSDLTKFEIIGNGTPTIAGEGKDNTTFKIKPLPGLGIGEHTATIKVYDDGADNEGELVVLYTAKVTFKVGKADITPTVSVTNWVYGSEPNHPSIIGNTGHADFTYLYEGINGTQYSASTPPSDAGEYRLTVTIEDTEQYNGGTCTCDFKITKKQVHVDESKVIFNNKTFDGDSSVTYVVTDALDISDNMYDNNYDITDNGGRAEEQAGTYTATVTFTIKPDFTRNYEFVGGGSSYTTLEKSYSITSVTPTLNVRNATIAKGNTLDLSTLVDVEYTRVNETNLDYYGIKDYLTFTEPSPAKPGVSISGNSILNVTNTANCETIQITVTSPARKLLENSGDNEFAEAQSTINITIVDKPVQVFNKEFSAKTVTYGDVLSNTFTLETGDGTISYSSLDETIATVNPTTGVVKGIKAGSTKIRVTASETTNFAEISREYDLEVTKKNVTVEKGSFEITKVYDGTTSHGTGNVNDLNIYGILTSDSEVRIKATADDYARTNVHVSECNVSLELIGTGKENYNLVTDTLRVPCSITTKNIDSTISIEVEEGPYNYTGNQIKPDVVVRDGSVAIPESINIGYDTVEYRVEYEDNTDAGEAKVKVSMIISESSGNYSFAPKYQTFTINKVDYAGTIADISKNVIENNEKEYELNLNEIGLGTGFKDTKIINAIKDGDLIKSVSYTDSQVKYTVNSKDAGTTGKVTLTISSKNYNDVTVVVNVVAIAKTEIEIEGLVFADKVFNNQPIQPTGTLTADGYDINKLEIKYTNGADYNSSEPPKNVGEYTVIYKVPDTDANYFGSTSWTFKITQATPSYDNPTDLTGIKGNKLSSITLPSGFTWNDENTDLVVGTHSYLATYTPTDTNYKVVNNVSISVYTKNKYNVTTSVTDSNGTISGSLLDVVEGSLKEISFTPNTGYMIDKVLVNDVDKTNTVDSNKITLTVNSDITVKVSYKKIPFTLTINEVTGATINPNGSINVSYGDSKTIEIKANHGYKLLSIKVNDVEKISELSNDKITLTDIKNDTNVLVVVEKIVYHVLEGENLKTKDLSKLRFRFDAEFDKFDTDGKVYVDNILVDSKNYKAESGSTIITLNEDYANSLSKENHQIKVVFNDGGEATANFTIVDPTANPQTGDNLLTYIIIFIISSLGIGTATIFAKKKLKVQR